MLPEAGSLFDAVAKAAEKNDTLVDACQVPAAIEVVDGMTAYQAQKNLTLRINLAHIAAGVQIFAPEVPLSRRTRSLKRARPFCRAA